MKITTKDPTEVELGREDYRSTLGYYARNMDRTAGPAINVKLHDMYDAVRKLEKGLGITIPDDLDWDAGGMIQNDVVQWEWEYYKDYIVELYPVLDIDLFTFGGRSGGWFVYDVHKREPTSWTGPGNYIDLEEAKALEGLWARIPEWVEGVAMKVAIEYARITLDKIVPGVIEGYWDHYMDEMKVAATLGNLDVVRFNLEQLECLEGLSDGAMDWASETVEDVAWTE